MDPTTTDSPTILDVTEPDALAKTWKDRVASARKHWEKFHQRVRHNRATVAGFNWGADPKTTDFYKPRANLIHGTISSVLPSIYARNPEISTTPIHKAKNLKLFCHTLETVTNRYLYRADLKGRAKATVRSALTTSFGVVKVMYQRDIQDDPIIKARMNDTQDNIVAIEGMIAEIDDPAQRGDLESKRLELDQLLRSLSEQVEVTAAEGLVVDRVLTDNVLIDPTVMEFYDYRDAGWIAQIIPMKKSLAEATYKKKLTNARTYEEARGQSGSGRLASAGKTGDEDRQIVVLEIWDKTTQTVYTLAEGCDFWLRDPYSPPKVGERFYPYFLLPFQLVDGQFVGPSLVDLTEKLQDEHNEARDRFNKHRDLAIPGWVAGGDTSDKSLERFAKSTTVAGFGEITIIDTEGKPLSQVIVPRQHPPIDPAVYDTTAVRYDWEQVTGMQDAARGSVVDPKTATEASIMQQNLSGRVSEFRDQTEDWLQEIAQYSAQILLQELTEPQVARVMGEHKETMVDGPMGPTLGREAAYDWPTLTRDQVFDMVEMKIRAGTTGAPDKLDQQEAWGKALPVITDLVLKIAQFQAQGMDAGPLIALLRESISRFDERLDVEQFIPKPPAPVMPGPQGAPLMPPGQMPV